MRILFTGGGTGGHIFPILAVARELKGLAEQNFILNLELYYLGPDGFGREHLAADGVRVIPIQAGKMRRYASARNVVDVFRAAIGIAQAFWYFFWIMPDVVFSKGGYGALPAVLAAALFRIPLVIHESDAVPGRVNRFSVRFAARIGVGFSSAAEHFPKDKTALVGIPIRKQILGGSPETAREELDIFSSLPVVGFIGGSQGAKRLNAAVLGVIQELVESFEVVHQTGVKNFADVKAEADVILEFTHRDHYHPFGFLEEGELRSFYQASDLIISRASSSIFEIAAWGKPAILIPLPTAAQDHQRRNASAYAAAGAARVVEEGNLTPHVLLNEIQKLMADRAALARMRESAQRFARIDSAQLVARELLKLGVHA